MRVNFFGNGNYLDCEYKTLAGHTFNSRTLDFETIQEAEDFAAKLNNALNSSLTEDSDSFTNLKIETLKLAELLLKDELSYDMQIAKNLLKLTIYGRKGEVLKVFTTSGRARKEYLEEVKEFINAKLNNFFIVWSPSATALLKHKYFSLESAAKEARRLSDISNHKFYVLKAEDINGLNDDLSF